MRILITGSRGFLGSSFGLFAARAGHEVLGIGRSSSAVAGWSAPYIQTDVATSDLSGVVKDFVPDVVLHAAGSASVANSLFAPQDDFRATVTTCANVLDSIRRSGTKPLIILPSSAAVYGNPIGLPINEGARPLPISPYGFHKYTCEVLANEYAKCFSQRIAVCRLFSVFGPRQRRLFVWEVFDQARSNNSSIELQGTGQELRDYLHVDDVTGVMLQLAASSTPNDCGKSLTVNVGSGCGIQVIQVAELIRQLVAPTKAIFCRGERRSGDPQSWQADISRLLSLAPNWQHRPFTERLTECVSEWMGEAY
ncbi:MAG: NAD-dependent epimerase/dehydratase family protein [Pyrinomonadaceae bacterium]